MKRYKITLAVGLLAVMTAATAEAQNLQSFIGVAPNNKWFVDANWNNGFVPSTSSDDVGIVNDNHVAYVDAPVADTIISGFSANPGEVRVGVNVGLGTGSAWRFAAAARFACSPACWPMEMSR